MFFESEVQTGIEDVGKDGLITNRALLKLLEEVGGYQSDKAGYGILDIDKKGVSWIILEWKVKVIKRPLYGEKLVIRTWGRNVKKATTYRDYEIYSEDNNLYVIATTKWVLININTKKIEKITQDIIDSYKIDEKSVFNEIELDKISIPKNFEKTIKYTPCRSDIDANRHMHNTHYLDIAYEALPEQVYENRPYNNFRICYKHEIKMGDVVSCNYAFDKEKNIVVIKNEQENIINSIIELWN